MVLKTHHVKIAKLCDEVQEEVPKLLKKIKKLKKEYAPKPILNICQKLKLKNVLPEF